MENLDASVALLKALKNRVTDDCFLSLKNNR
jgi:hypothetical protein